MATSGSGSLVAALATGAEASGVVVAGEQRKHVSGGGFTWGLAWERAGVMENSIRGLARAKGEGSRAHGGLWWSGGSDERSRVKQNAREREKGLSSSYTSARSSEKS